MKAIVILNGRERFECEVPDCERIEIDPPWDDVETRIETQRLAIGTRRDVPTSRRVVVCYRAGDEDGVPIFRERT